MALNAGKIPNKTKFERPPALDPGTYPARVVQILSLGVQEQRPFRGEPKDPAAELMVTYELLDEFLLDEEGKEIDDKPRWISETFPLYSLDSDLAKSTKRYSALDPNFEYGGDWSQLAGTPCMVNIVQNQGKGKNADRIFENITGISTMRDKEAKKAPELKNPPKVFDIDEPDMEIFKSLPQWIQDKMKEAEDFDGGALQRALEGDDDTPKGGRSQDKEKAPEEPENGSEDEEGDW